jgi:hypothetical protein
MTPVCNLFAVSGTLKCPQLDEDQGLSGYEPDIVCLTYSNSFDRSREENTQPAPRRPVRIQVISWHYRVEKWKCVDVF